MDFGSIASALPVVGSLFGGAADVYQTNVTNDFNRDQLRWQKEVTQNQSEYERKVAAENFEYQKGIDAQNLAWADHWNQANYDLARTVQAQNYEQQIANLQYQKDLQQTIFNREDNATQRRAADLKAAGLSPVLAAGSAANAGAVVKTEPPQMQAFSRNFTPQNSTAKKEVTHRTVPSIPQLSKFSGSEIARNVMESLRMDPEIQRTAAQTLLTNSQIDTQETQRKLLEAERAKIEAERRRVNEETERLRRDNKILNESGTPSNPSTFGKIFNDVIGVVLNANRRFERTQKEMEDKQKKAGGK